jgi:hypothetical protein
VECNATASSALPICTIHDRSLGLKNLIAKDAGTILPIRCSVFRFVRQKRSSKWHGRINSITQSDGVRRASQPFRTHVSLSWHFRVCSKFSRRGKAPSPCYQKLLSTGAFGVTVRGLKSLVRYSVRVLLEERQTQVPSISAERVRARRATDTWVLLSENDSLAGCS